MLKPVAPPYDPLDWLRKPLAERGRMVCEAWAIQGYGTPVLVYAVYGVKVLFFVAIWAFFCGFSPALGPISSIQDWWLNPIAFQKAIVWSLLFEVLGMGCGSGPLTGRYMPPLGGFLYFLRPGTTKLPMFPGVPVGGSPTRGLLDVLLYLALIGACIQTLLAPVPGYQEFLPIVILVPVLGILDKTIFLAARAEHYWVTVVCFVATPDWLAGAMAVQLALWFWAGVSKLNHHFPTVVCVMASNSPTTRFAWFRKLMYRNYPEDLRPSRMAEAMSHMGTVLEIGVPLAFLLTPLGTAPLIAILLMLGLHSFITSNVPMGVPIEWNVVVVYGGFALFWAHPDISLLSLAQTPVLAVFLGAMLVAVPLLGNLYPQHFSFLLAMRYYAGNWAWSVWFFKGDCYKKLDKLVKSSGWINDQLEILYDRATGVGLIGKVMGFRLMHLHGRALPILLPKAVPALPDYEWVDGELVAGMVLGWNFGEGHLHQEQLLRAVQQQCGFEEGELRCIFAESQPLHKSSFEYRIWDAKSGLLERGELSVPELRTRQPWELPAV